MLKSGNDPKGTLQIQKYSRKSTKTRYEHQEYMAFKPQAIPPCPSQAGLTETPGQVGTVKNMGLPPSQFPGEGNNIFGREAEYQYFSCSFPSATWRTGRISLKPKLQERFSRNCVEWGKKGIKLGPSHLGWIWKEEKVCTGGPSAQRVTRSSHRLIIPVLGSYMEKKSSFFFFKVFSYILCFFSPNTNKVN